MGAVWRHSDIYSNKFDIGTWRTFSARRLAHYMLSLVRVSLY